jgi:hypothetical protein
MQSKSQLPDFLVLGAAKSGTTSLYKYLGSHPEIYMSPIKEPRYFAFPNTRPVLIGPKGVHPKDDPVIIWKTEDYRRLFAGRTTEAVAGEISPPYLYCDCSPVAIKKMIPHARLIAILREPSARAFSQYCNNRRNGREPLRNFAAAIAAEDKRIAAGWMYIYHYRARGFYVRQLKRYLELFPREQMLVLLYDDMVADCNGLLAKICSFLGVDANYRFDTTTRHNVNDGMPRSLFLNRFLHSVGPVKQLIRALMPADVRLTMFRKMSDLNLGPTPVFDPNLRWELAAAFEQDVLELEKLIDRDLSAWLRN